MIEHKKAILTLLILQLLVACTITIMPNRLPPASHGHAKHIHTLPLITPAPAPISTPTPAPTPDSKYRWAPYREN